MAETHIQAASLSPFWLSWALVPGDMVGLGGLIKHTKGGLIPTFLFRFQRWAEFSRKRSAFGRFCVSEPPQRGAFQGKIFVCGPKMANNCLWTVRLFSKVEDLVVLGPIDHFGRNRALLGPRLSGVQRWPGCHRDGVL